MDIEVSQVGVTLIFDWNLGLALSPNFDFELYFYRTIFEL